MITVSVRGLTVEHRGHPPFVARSASDKTENWSYWYVHGADRINWMHVNEHRGTMAAKFVSRDIAIEIAEALNAQA